MMNLFFPKQKVFPKRVNRLYNLIKFYATGNENSSENTSSNSNKKAKQKGIRLPGDEDYKNPWTALSYEFEYEVNDIVPRQVDIAIIGGGIMGWAAAYFIKANSNLSVAVIERDPSHSRAASVLGIGAIRQQFSEPENIKMSLFAADFLRNVREHLSILDLDPPDIQFHPHGFLTLASEKGFADLKHCYEVQRQLGAKVELLHKQDIKTIWPWMEVDDVGGGIHGYENEGWFDPWLLLNALQRKAFSLGVQRVHGEVVGFDFYYAPSSARPVIDIDVMEVKHPRNVLVRLLDGNVQPITFAFAVNAAGPWAGEIGKHLGLGDSSRFGGVIPLPVEPRIQYAFVVSPNPKISIQKPGIDCPFIVDYDGLNVRRDRLGGDFIVFLENPPLSKRSHKSSQFNSDIVGETGLNVDFSFFDRQIRHQLARRIPVFSDVTVRSGWASHLDYNYIDQNLIIGRHPNMYNVFHSVGSTGHGIEHSLAAGRAISEMILYAIYRTIDLTNFGFERFYENNLVFEKEVY